MVGDAGVAAEAWSARLLVTSAGSANGGGYDALLGFDAEGQPTGPFSSDQRIVDPRGLSLDPSSALTFLNSGDDRVLALDRRGEIVRDSVKLALEEAVERRRRDPEFKARLQGIIAEDRGPLERLAK
jgi:hypothetical protein